MRTVQAFQDYIVPRGDDPDFMLSLARGLAVVRAFAEAKRPMNVGQIALRTGLSRAAARRCAHTLAALGYLAEEDGAYSLTPRILDLGYAYLASAPLAQAAQPALERVSAALGQSSSLAVLDGADIRYVARSARSRILSVDLEVGSRLPAAPTAMGRVLMAALPPRELNALLAREPLRAYTARTLTDPDAFRAELARIAAQGYAVVDQEYEIGLRVLAVPVRTPGGEVAAAINVSLQAEGDFTGAVAAALPILRQAAEEIRPLLRADPR